MIKSPMQTSLHMPKTTGDKIGSNFFYPFGKVCFSTPQPERFNQGTVSDSRAEFSYVGTGTYLESTYMIQRFPPLRVKKNLRGRVRIRLTHNLLLNTMKEIAVEANGVAFTTLSKVYLDFWLQFFRKPEFTTDTLEQIGNIPEIEEWTDYIKAFQGSFDLPMPYSLDQALSFPLCLVDTFSLKIGIRHKIADLLQMQELKMVRGERVWVDVKPPRMSYLGLDSAAKIPVPEIWGEVGYNSDFEIEWLKCKAVHDVWYTDVITLKSPNSESPGDKLSIPISLEYPIKAFLWVAENATASSNHYYSNYTTNPTNVKLGKNPIRCVSFEYTNAKKFEDMPSVHFDSVYPKRHFKSARYEQGYNGYAVCKDPINIAIDSGLVTSSTKPVFTAELGHDNYGNDMLEEELGDEQEDDLEIAGEETECKYYLHLCCLVLRKISFVRNEDGKGCKILLDSVDIDTESGK